MDSPLRDYDAYAFSRQPGYDEPAVRKEFAKAIPLRTVVIYCFDPRVTGIPAVVAAEFGDVHPGEVLTDDQGNKIASTTTMAEVVVAGGRAVDALRSVTVAQHLFGVENIVVVHHTNCGATSFTADGIIDAYEREHGADISKIFRREDICISDYESSLKHDVQVLRQSAGTPRQANIFGCLYDTDRHELTRVTENLGVQKVPPGEAAKVGG